MFIKLVQENQTVINMNNHYIEIRNTRILEKSKDIEINIAHNLLEFARYLMN